MDEEERKRIEAEATWRARVDSDLDSLKQTRRQGLWAIGAAALTIISQMWDQIKTVIFHGN